MVFFEYDAEMERAVHHGLPFGSYITLTDMVRSS